MEDPNPLNDIRFLRDVVARTQSPAVNRRWPVTLSWGCIVTIGYIACALLGMEGKIAVIPWVMPVLVFLIGWPLHWYLARQVRLSAEERGVRPRLRKDLMYCWLSLAGIGGLWTAGLIISVAMPSRWYLIVFVWGSLYLVGFIMNGFMLSREWFWAAICMLASLIAAWLAGPRFYWLPGVWIGGSLILAGLLGRQNARRHDVGQAVEA